MVKRISVLMVLLFGQILKKLRMGIIVLGCIERYLGIDLCGAYRDKSNYYGMVFRVPIDEIIFDGKDSVVIREDKVRYLLKHSLLTLYGCYFHCPSNSNNPMIRIRDDAKAKIDHCILIEA